MQLSLTRILGLGVLALVLASCSKGDEPDESPATGQLVADLLLLNGYVYTSDGQGTIAQAVAVNAADDPVPESVVPKGETPMAAGAPAMMSKGVLVTDAHPWTAPVSW